MPMGDPLAAPPRRSPEYRALDERRGGSLSAILAIARWTLRPLLRRPPFWMLIGLGWLGFLTTFTLIFVKAELAAQNPGWAKALDRVRVTGTAAAFRDFLLFQARAVELILAYVGVAGVLNDFRTGGLSFYLSKPISRWTYAAGKLLALAAIIGFVTLIPGVMLWLAAGWFNNGWEYWRDNLHALRGIVGYSLAIMIFESLALLALASWFRKPAPLLVCWSALFAGLAVLGGALEVQSGERGWRLLGLWWDIAIVGAYAFGAPEDPLNWPYVKWAFAVLGGLALAAAWVVRRNLRAVEVVE